MDEDGVSPIIGTVLVLAILTIVTSTLISVVWPEVQDSSDRGDFQVVSGQLAKVASDVNQLALGGNEGELRQRTVAVPDGDLRLERGHLWAISVGIQQERFTPGGSATRDHHPAFDVQEAEPTGTSFMVGYQDKDYEDDDNDLYCSLARFSGSDWKAVEVTEDCEDTGADVGYDGTFPVSFAGGQTLRDGPWRLRVFDDAQKEDLIGEIFVYELNRINYHFEGAAKPRGVLIENGDLFMREDTRVFSAGSGLYRTGDTGGGTSGLNLRAAQLDSDTLPGSTGRAKTTFHLALEEQVHFSHQVGAIHARLQPLSGPMTTQWASHLAGDGFDESASGVYFTWGTEDPDVIAVYPLSVIYSHIDLRMVSE